MTNVIPLIDAHQRNCSLHFSVKDNSLFFTVTRFDGHPFNLPLPFCQDAFNSELEKKFIEIADLFEGY
jgi:hypothetical protein